jgi:ribosomal protein L12E/L44/L45/RPP1/RPP2
LYSYLRPNQDKSSPGQRVIIYKLSPDQLHAEIAAVESCGNVTNAAVLQKQADADPYQRHRDREEEEEEEEEGEEGKLGGCPIA